MSMSTTSNPRTEPSKPRTDVDWRAIAEDCAEGRMTPNRMLLILSTHPSVTSYILDSVEKSNVPRASAEDWFTAIWRDAKGPDPERRQAARKMFVMLEVYEDAMEVCRRDGLIEVRRLDSGRRHYVPTTKGMMVTSLMSGWISQAVKDATDEFKTQEPERGEGALASPEYQAHMKVMDTLSDLETSFDETGTKGWMELDVADFIGGVLGGEVETTPPMFRGWPPRQIAY